MKPRDVHSLKAGFREEGRQRSAVLRDGIHYHLISMSILAEEWSAQAGLPLSFQSTRTPESGDMVAGGFSQRNGNEQAALSMSELSFCSKR